MARCNSTGTSTNLDHANKDLIQKVGYILADTQHYVIWGFHGEILYKLESPEETLLAAGIVSQDQIPSPRVRSCKRPNEDGGVFKCSRLGNGNLCAIVSASRVINQDIAFKRFMGSLLADTHLSLVKGERDV